jgi:hypothetical protein
VPGFSFSGVCELAWVRCTEVWELLEQIAVRLKAVGRDLPLGDEGQAMRYDVVGEDATVRIPSGFRGVIAHHVRQELLGVDRGDSFLSGIISSVAQHMNELIEEALPVVNRLSSIVFLFGFVRVEEARDRRVAISIGMDELAVAAYAASPPDADLGLGSEHACR